MASHSAKEGPATPFPVVAVGSSAGGFEAFRDILRHLDKDFGMAIVLIQHLDPKHESQLASLLSRAGPLPVSEATEGDKVQPGRVYVIPPDAHIVMRKGELHLQPRGPNRGQPTTIDLFMRSLAEDQGGQSIGIVLSGTLSDGTAGLREIKAAGGFTFAQDLESARYHEMPRSAIQAGHVDFVLPPKEIAAELTRLAERLPLRMELVETPQEDDKNALLDQLFSIVRNRTGVDFTLYKRSTLERRISRRMMATRVDALTDYLGILRKDPDEARRLYEEVLIHVTRFFRDAEYYTRLEKEVFPQIIEGREAGEEIRIWVAGCATGEEAYSIAILLHRFQQAQGTSFPVQLFATDLSDSAISTARLGVYPDTISQDVPPDLLKTYFHRSENGYSISKTIRSMCVFAVHDVTRDPPFSNMDLVSCRNVMIYMEPPNQRRVLAVFHYALRSNAYLALGTSETTGRGPDLFEAADFGGSIFKRLNARSPSPTVFAASGRFGPVSVTSPEVRSATPAEHEESTVTELLLANHAPAGLVLDGGNNVTRYIGDCSRFVLPARGEATLQLHKLLREGLAGDVMAAVRQARTGNPGTVERVRFNGPNGTLAAKIHAYCLRAEARTDSPVLVVFEEIPGLAGVGKGNRAFSFLHPRRLKEAEARVAELEEGLAEARITMRSLVEDYETTTEELRCANEEALSSNEELQSTNEELETAKEEAQSTNEELRTLNEELIHRSAEIQKVNNDLTNLLHSVEMPIIMLSRSQVIRRFTPQAQKVFRLIPTDLGRPITDITSPFKGVNIKDEVMTVLEDLQRRKINVEGEDGQAYRMEIHPYRTSENQIDGVVIIVLPA